MIFLTGDCCNPVIYNRLYIFDNWIKNQNITEQVYLIVCGDFIPIHNKGFKDLAYINELTEKFDYTILWVDNRVSDNLDKYLITSKFKGRVHCITDKIYRLGRGELYTIEGNKIFTMGGSGSIKSIGDNNIPDCENTTISRVDVLNGRVNTMLEDYVDYIITNECPTHITRHISLINTGDENKYTTDQNNTYMDKILEWDLGQKLWYFSNYHMDKTFEDFQILEDNTEKITNRYRVLFNDIVKLGEVDPISI